MKNNETGEFELVLGNRQLLSGFFIVVLLFGVAFAMGYIVGRNSTPSSKLQAEASTATTAPTESRPQPVTPTPPAPAPAASTSDQPPAQPADQAAPSTPPADAPAQPVTQPAHETPPPAAAEPTPVPAEAPPGSYWQVIATSNHTSAEALAQSLKDKGLPVTLSPGPNNLVRVLVGPYTDTASMGKAKTKLEDAGFHPVRK